jgi:hypothetical protein
MDGISHFHETLISAHPSRLLVASSETNRHIFFEQKTRSKGHACPSETRHFYALLVVQVKTGAAECCSYAQGLSLIPETPIIVLH